MKYEALHLLSLITAIFEGLFFSGLIFGWSSLSYILKGEGYFSHLCKDEANITASIENNVTVNGSSTEFLTCKAQDETINMVFVVASVALSFSTLPNGFIFDKFGTMVARIFATLLFTCGLILSSIASIDTSWLLFPGMCCIAIGGIFFLLTNMQLGALFGPARSSVITILNGALDSSSVVFLLFKLCYESGITLSTIFQFVACCTIFQWIRTIFLMPQYNIPFPLPSGVYRYGILSRNRTSTANENLETPDDALDLPEVEVKSGKEEKDAGSSYWECLKSASFITNLFHFSMLQLRNYFFLGTFVAWLISIIPNGDDNLGHYINVFGICQFFGVLTAPLNGLLVDLIKSFLSKTCSNDRVTSTKALAVSALATTLLGTLFSICVAIPNINLQYLSFVLQVIFRSFLYGGNSSFIAFSFPGEHFGKLYGMTLTLSGIVTLLQFPLFNLVLYYFDNDFAVMNIVFVVVCLLTLIHPIYLYWQARSLEAKQTEASVVEMEKLTNGDHAANNGDL